MIIDKKVVVTISTVESGDYIENKCECCGYSGMQLTQKTYFSLDELLSESWFVQFIKERGFYSKEEIDTSDNTHLNNFVYGKICGGFGSHEVFSRNLSDFREYSDDLSGVYQEVIGPECLKQVKKFNDRRKACLAAQKLLQLKAADKEQARKEKARMKKIEKAKKVLEEENT